MQLCGATPLHVEKTLFVCLTYRDHLVGVGLFVLTYYLQNQTVLMPFFVCLVVSLSVRFLLIVCVCMRVVRVYVCVFCVSGRTHNSCQEGDEKAELSNKLNGREMTI